MKKIALLSIAIFVFSAAAAAQDVSPAKIKAAMARFPGVPKANMEEMLAAKRVMQIALPTWLPAGFELESIKSRLGRGVALEDREFIIIYTRRLEKGKFQRFALESGFDGLGGLPYDVTHQIRSAVGQIDLMYEPKDIDSDQKLKGYVMTEWLLIGKTNFHYIGMYNPEPPEDSEASDPNQIMISLADTKKILASLQRL